MRLSGSAGAPGSIPVRVCSSMPALSSSALDTRLVTSARSSGQAEASTLFPTADSAITSASSTLIVSQAGNHRRVIANF